MHKTITALRAQLLLLFPERQVVIDGALAAVLAGEHVLLLGPPGTAKSALVRSLAQAFGGTYFERLLTKFSTPEELFGPVSLKGLESDHFTRVTTGMLPEAEFAFVDEVFKANSAILNALLSVVNERLFHNCVFRASRSPVPREADRVFHAKPITRAGVTRLVFSTSTASACWSSSRPSS